MDTKDEIIQLQRQLFELEMKDHWDNADFDLARELHNEIKKLEEES